MIKMSSRDRRQEQCKDLERALPAMRAAVAVKAYDVAADVAETCNVLVCPVCVKTLGKDVYGQRVTYNGGMFWICNECADKHINKRSRKPVPFLEEVHHVRMVMVITGLIRRPVQ